LPPGGKGPKVTVTTQEQPAGRSFGRKYKDDDYAHYYAQKHESGALRRLSNVFERKMIRRALMRIRSRRAIQTVLDCPSGAGRFLPVLAQLQMHVVAIDTSPQMLQQGRQHTSLFRETPTASAGSAFALPLADKTVDVVLCSRLLHHIAERESRVQIMREFARVARVGVVVSFFDATSWNAWKRRRKIKRTGKSGGRHAMTRSQCNDEARVAGLQPIGMNALLRYHTEVTAAAYLLPDL